MPASISGRKDLGSQVTSGVRPGTSEISMKSEKLPSVYTLNFTATGYTDGNSIKSICEKLRVFLRKFSCGGGGGGGWWWGVVVVVREEQGRKGRDDCVRRRDKGPAGLGARLAESQLTRQWGEERPQDGVLKTVSLTLQPTSKT